VPQEGSWITQVEHANTLELHRRGLAQNAGIPLRTLLALDVLPPGIRILDSQAHHETSRMLFDVKCLQQKTKRAVLELRNLIVAPIDGESEVGIELPGECGIFGWHERLEIGHGLGCIGFFLTQNIASSPALAIGALVRVVYSAQPSTIQNRTGGPFKPGFGLSGDLRNSPRPAAGI
jgi:hypothetical protein